jgi:hypothetical protein
MTKKTGKAVRDVKGTTDEAPVPSGTQVHAGNIGVLTVKLLNDINVKLGKLLEVANG